MKKYLSLALLFVLFAPTIALGQVNWNQGMENFRNETGLTNQDLTVVVGRIVQLLLSFLGLIAVVIIIIGGFQWMTSGGNEERIGAAKKLMGSGIIGLAIIVLAYAVASFILSALRRIGT
jgi:uncharacterized membrane protein YidH (DUF202 family)